MKANLTLAKAIHLITSKHTSQLKDRHVATVRRICSEKSSYSEGFWYKDLEEVNQLIGLLNEGLQDGYVSII